MPFTDIVSKLHSKRNERNGKNNHTFLVQPPVFFSFSYSLSISAFDLSFKWAKNTNYSSFVVFWWLKGTSRALQWKPRFSYRCVRNGCSNVTFEIPPHEYLQYVFLFNLTKILAGVWNKKNERFRGVSIVLKFFCLFICYLL